MSRQGDRAAARRLPARSRGPGLLPPARFPVRGVRRALGALDGAAKRTLDVSLVLVQFLLTLPAWVLIPLAIKFEDGGPVFYGQQRVGRGGRTFTSWKFRSMAPRKAAGGDAGEDSAAGDGGPETGAPLPRAELEEERITRVGSFLRATALDELPQLWSILVGDMSYVGPRALLPEEVVDPDAEEPVRLDELPGYEERHSVRPGLTGLAQVHLPRDVSHRRKIRYDLVYVRRRTLWLDLRLIFRSVWISLTGRWPDVGRRG